MILFDNGFIKLEYEPTKDILFVDLPSVNMVFVAEAKRALATIVEHVRIYDIKNLLIDARNTAVEIDEGTYSAMLTDFMRDLTTTRLKKIARIVSVSVVRETVVKKVYGEQKLPWELQSFTDTTPAIEWLTSSGE